MLLGLLSPVRTSLWCLGNSLLVTLLTHTRSYLCVPSIVRLSKLSHPGLLMATQASFISANTNTHPLVCTTPHRTLTSDFRVDPELISALSSKDKRQRNIPTAIFKPQILWITEGHRTLSTQEIVSKGTVDSVR